MKLFGCPSEWSKIMAIKNGRAHKYMCNRSVSQIYFSFFCKTLFFELIFRDLILLVGEISTKDRLTYIGLIFVIYKLSSVKEAGNKATREVKNKMPGALRAVFFPELFKFGKSLKGSTI